MSSNGPTGPFCAGVPSGVAAGATTDQAPSGPLPTLPVGLVLNQQRRTASSGGLLMNIGYLEENNGGDQMITSNISEAGGLDEMTAMLPRPASAGAAAAIPGMRAGQDQETVLYDYPPAASNCQKTPPPLGASSRGSSRHRGINNLKKQHSVSCANHCCENDNNV